MAEVHIDSLTLENFGPYYGEHTLQFNSLEGRCGILIGGKTGAGKTHLLRALYLAVVGESGIGDLKKLETGSDATRFIFEHSLNRKAESEGKDTTKLSVSLSQRDERGAGSRRIKIVRQIRHRPSSPPVWESYAIKSSSSGQQEDDEQVIQRLRDSFLPRHLARFFFFDAERSQSLHLGQQDIVEGISRILGLWTYGELENDLRQLIQSKIPKAFPGTGSSDAASNLADISGKILAKEGGLKAKRQELSGLKLELREIETELSEVEDKLKAFGAVDPKELQKSQERRTEIAGAKASIETLVAEAWETAMPIALLGPFRKQLYDDLSREEKRRDWDNSRSTVEPKIPQVKSDVFEGVPNEFKLTSDYQEYYSSRLETALHRLFHPPPEGMAESIYIVERNDTSAQVRAKLSTGEVSLRNLADQCTNLERMESEVRELDQKLKQLTQDATALARGGELHSQRGELTTRQTQKRDRIVELEADIERMEGELAELKREEKNYEELAKKAEKGQCLAVLASRYREVASEVKSRAADTLRRRISENVGNLWIEITEREKEFASMEFDSHWNCFLVRRDGKRASWEETNTSAGQRQVRLLAFYEALRRLAKLVPPLVVDTPLGRLDKEVKDAVLDKLYLTGHQSIILSTNSEIDPESSMFDRVSDRLSRVFTLHPYGKEGSANYEVRISADYFGRTL